MGWGLVWEQEWPLRDDEVPPTATGKKMLMVVMEEPLTSEECVAELSGPQDKSFMESERETETGMTP